MNQPQILTDKLQSSSRGAINPNDNSLGIIKQKNIEKDATRAKSKEDEMKSSGEKKDSNEHFKIDLERKLSPDAAVAEATGAGQSNSNPVGQSTNANTSSIIGSSLQGRPI